MRNLVSGWFNFYQIYRKGKIILHFFLLLFFFFVRGAYSCDKSSNRCYRREIFEHRSSASTFSTLIRELFSRARVNVRKIARDLVNHTRELSSAVCTSSRESRVNFSPHLHTHTCLLAALSQGPRTLAHDFCFFEFPRVSILRKMMRNIPSYSWPSFRSPF